MNKKLMGQYAGFGTRALAFIVDIIIIYFVQVLVTWTTTTVLMTFRIDVTACAPWDGWQHLGEVACYAFRYLLTVFNLTFGFFYTAFFWILQGQTMGKYIMGVRVVRLDGKRMNLMRSFIRYTGYLLSLLPLMLGFFWMLGEDRRRGWHDKLAGTVVVYAWEARPDERFLVRFNQRLNHRFQITNPETTSAPAEDSS